MADAAHDAFADTLPAPRVPDDHGRWKVVLDPPPRGSREAPWQCRYCDWQPTCARDLLQDDVHARAWHEVSAGVEATQ